MVLPTSSTSNSNMDPAWLNLIELTIKSENSQRLDKYTQQKDDLDVQKSIYTDLKNNLAGLLEKAKTLKSTDSTYALNTTRKATISQTASGKTALTGSTDSSAALGSYAIQVATLAKNQRFASTQQSSSGQALGKSGSMTLNGTAITVDSSDTLYSLASKVNSATYASGKGVSASVVDNSLVFTAVNSGVYQTINVSGSAAESLGFIDTGYSNQHVLRAATTSLGQQIGSDKQSTSGEALGISGTFALNGASITVESTDTLADLVTKVNSEANTYTSGKKVTASMVDNHLVLTSEEKVVGSTISISDSSGTAALSLGLIGRTIKNELTVAADATFSVNGQSVTRSSNTSLSDVISGVTLNLLAETGTETVSLTVETDTSAMKNAITSFNTSFNTLQTYLDQKTGSTKIDDKHYERGALANDYTVRGLRRDLADAMSSGVSSSGSIKSMLDLGLDFDTDLKLMITDSTKLESALRDNPDGVKAFLDAKMGSLDTMLSGYVGTQGSMTYSLTSMEDRSKDLTAQIERENVRVDQRRQALMMYYETLNTQMNQLLQTQSLFSSLYKNQTDYYA